MRVLLNAVALVMCDLKTLHIEYNPMMNNQYDAIAKR